MQTNTAPHLTVAELPPAMLARRFRKSLSKQVLEVALILSKEIPRETKVSFCKIMGLELIEVVNYYRLPKTSRLFHHRGVFANHNSRRLG